MSCSRLMHPRNIYREPPDFERLAADYPELVAYLSRTKNGKCRVDFRDPKALRILTKILLHKDFGLVVKIPEDSLIPVVPQRLNYILWIEDLLKQVPKPSSETRGIDIGTGPCCIFALLGAKRNGWHFLATEVDDESIQHAEANVSSNNLENMVKVVKSSGDKLLEDICELKSKTFDFCICNPPFFSSEFDSRRKKKLYHKPKMQEVKCKGGEVAFMERLIYESLSLQGQIRIYSSMLGKRQSLEDVISLLNSKGLTYTWTEFGQGNTVRWGIAWTFLSECKQSLEVSGKFMSEFVFCIPHPQSVHASLSLEELATQLKSLLHDFQISFKVRADTESEVQFQLVSYQNTWSRLRRKRRELQKRAKTSQGCECIPNCTTVNLKSAQTDEPVSLFQVSSVGNNVRSSGLHKTCVPQCITSVPSQYHLCEKIPACQCSCHSSLPPSEILFHESPVVSCCLLLKNCCDGIQIRVIHTGSSKSEVVYQLFQLFKNTFGMRK